MDKIDTDILIVGGGAAGMSAALAASQHSDFRISVVDDNPQLGGQIWRSEMGKIKSPDARKLIEKIKENRIKILTGTQVYAQEDDTCLLAETRRGTTNIHFTKLILATGARERFLPFPNWTLPNIFGAGGLQALVKNGLSVENKRVIVAGTGPLLLAVAAYLKSKGANVLFIAEQASRGKLLKFGVGLWRNPNKLFQAVGLRSRLFGVKYMTDCFITSAKGNGKLEAINLTRHGKNWLVECDYLACGFHLVPNIELASLIKCKVKSGNVVVNEYQETSVADVFCAGEPTGIEGVDLSLLEGKIAGLSAVGKKEEVRKLLSKCIKLRRFADNLNTAFSLRDELKSLSKSETIVCRCEDVSFDRLKAFSSFREAKMQTRCGMGACQGRICGAATKVLFDWENTSFRPPIFPVKLGNLTE